MVRSSWVPVPASLDACVALLAYEGPAREVVAQLKYRNARSSVAWLAMAMAALVPSETPDLVTWAPTTPDRRRRRGFDHAEVLARRVARELSVPCRTLLRRSSNLSQTGHTLAVRLGAPEFEPCRRIDAAHVIVVDDVVTTGSTFHAAGRALRSAGAARVVGLAAAHPS